MSASTFVRLYRIGPLGSRAFVEEEMARFADDAGAVVGADAMLDDLIKIQIRHFPNL